MQLLEVPKCSSWGCFFMQLIGEQTQLIGAQLQLICSSFRSSNAAHLSSNAAHLGFVRGDKRGGRGKLKDLTRLVKRFNRLG